MSIGTQIPDIHYYSKRKQVKRSIITIAVLVLVGVLLWILAGHKTQKQETLTPFDQAQKDQPTEMLTHKRLEREKTALEQNTTTLFPASGTGFVLTDTLGEEHHITVDGSDMLFQDISHPVVILYFFTPWSLPSQSETPYLSELQKKYHDNIFIMGILLNPQKYATEIGKFIQTYHADFYIADGKENNRFARTVLSSMHISDTVPVPLIVLYHGGHYDRHYEGAIPIEMLEHDIKTLLH